MNSKSGIVWQTSSADIELAVEKLLNEAELSKALKEYEIIILKPNLVEASKPPITTPVELIAAIVNWLERNCSHLQIIIAEGNGVPEYDTSHCFDLLGYTELARDKNIELIDLNIEPCKTLANSNYGRLAELDLPEILFDGFLMSVPVLKAHSLSKVTLAMKNLIGCVPPTDGGGWRKSQLHHNLHEAIFDLNRYRTADFSIIDGSVGMAQAHLWGPTCDPPVGKIIASYDPVAIDAHGSSLLQRDWQDIDHIKLANSVLGLADPLEIKAV